MASSDQSPPDPCSEHRISISPDSTQKLKRLKRAQWLRAAILGANDGLLSTTSLMLGIGAAREDKRTMVLSGLAGALAGACSMSVGEFVSVSTQRDIEKSTARISSQSSKSPDNEDNVPNVQDGSKSIPDDDNDDPKSPNSVLDQPGSPPQGESPVIQVIEENKEMINVRIVQEDIGGDDHQDVLGSPYKAAFASGISFLCGAVLPLSSAIFFAHNVSRIAAIVVVTTIALALFGGLGAYLGGSPVRISATRVLFGGWLAMAITYGLLRPFESDHKGNCDTF